jgi:hypothetical protein
VLLRCFEANCREDDPALPAYKRLQDAYNGLTERGDESGMYLSDVFFHDLVTWYHLVWSGEAVRRSSRSWRASCPRASASPYEDRPRALHVYGELIASLIPRYRALSSRKRVGAHDDADHHPLAPLLINLQSAREAMPGAELPKSREYPGGTARVADHLSARWTRTSGASREGRSACGRPEGLRFRAAPRAPRRPRLQVVRERRDRDHEFAALERRRGRCARAAHQPFRLAGNTPGPLIFFRSDLLSDLIGFEYAKWNGNDAALNFISRLEEVAHALPEGHPRAISVILDGENCWEYYDYNGYYFLEALYREIEARPHIRMTTVRDYIARPRGEARDAAAPDRRSWVYGNFSTWIGSPDKNRAWDLLCAAKQSFDLVMASGRLTDEQRAAAYSQLAACEASDWFWWLGDYNPGPAVQSFDELFRGSLSNLYRLLQLPPPAILAQPISHGSGHPEAGGTMRVRESCG